MLIYPSQNFLDMLKFFAEPFLSRPPFVQTVKIGPDLLRVSTIVASLDQDSSTKTKIRQCFDAESLN
jgi:hypothetical protein